ncbi:hypothetical protein KR222_008271, partial [Zaprionus bogoriensis]
MEERIGSYQRARRKFAITVYLVTMVWLILALAQWLIVSLVDDIRQVFYDYEWISVISVFLAIILLLIFIFIEEVRFTIVLNLIITILTVEFAAIGIFALVARTKWPDMLMWFFICLLIMFLFILIGTVIPHDLTLDVVIIFVISFIFLITSIFLIMMYVMTQKPYAFIMYHIFVSIIILLFIMYHAQTINGGRFAEMRVNDYLLATLIFYYDFIILFLLTFYLQKKYPVASD